MPFLEGLARTYVFLEGLVAFLIRQGFALDGG